MTDSTPTTHTCLLQLIEAFSRLRVLVVVPSGQDRTTAGMLARIRTASAAAAGGGARSGGAPSLQPHP